jgi:hypothetical protein
VKVVWVACGRGAVDFVLENTYPSVPACARARAGNPNQRPVF